MTTTASDKIIVRIRQLLAMAADTPSPHEASIAAGRARKLMDTHQVSLDDLKDESTGFGFQKVDKAYRFMPYWKDILCVAIAQFNDCKSIKSHEWKVQGSNSYAYRLMFQGFEHDVIVAAAMYDYLTATIDRLCAAYMKELALGKSLTRLSDAYKKAAALELVGRLNKLQKEREEQVIRTSTGTSLVVFKMAQVEAEFGVAKYVNKKPSAPAKKDAALHAARARGYQDGAAIGIDAQIEPESKKTAVR
jgi:hypothetical protein